MTTTYQSGSAVLSGYYLDLAGWHLAPVAHDGDRLPSGRGSWRRVPTAAALLAAPLLGAAFVVFLPVIGFVVLLRALAAPVLAAFRGPAGDLAATLSTGWQPGEAHFTGKRPGEAAAPHGDALEALAREIERRRRNR
jgi:hypothetical protein